MPRMACLFVPNDLIARERYALLSRKVQDEYDIVGICCSLRLNGAVDDSSTLAFKQSRKV